MKTPKLTQTKNYLLYLRQNRLAKTKIFGKVLLNVHIILSEANSLECPKGGYLYRFFSLSSFSRYCRERSLQV